MTTSCKNCCMKRVQQRARRRGSAGHLHQSIFEIEFFNGGATVSIDGLVGKWTTREAMDVIQAKPLDAEKTSNLGSVKVSMGKNFRFGSRAGAELLAA